MDTPLRKALKWTLGVGALGYLGVSLFCTGADRLAGVRWIMVNVNQTEQQADAHLLTFADGKNILIDVGADGRQLLPRLKARGIKKIDDVIVSHPHKDHYGGLRALMASPISVGRVHFNFPVQEICDKEQPWGCDFNDVSRLFEEIQGRGIPLVSAKAGDILYEGGGSTMRVLTAYDGINNPTGRADINDTSLVLLLTYGSNRVLFTGDLNLALGTWMATHEPQVKANLLKAPHHGTEAAAPDEFFDAVHPSAVLVPSPKGLWLSDRSKRIRDYFALRKIPAWVNGLDGEVVVDLFTTSYLVRSQRGWPGRGTLPASDFKALAESPIH